MASLHIAISPSWACWLELSSHAFWLSRDVTYPAFCRPVMRATLPCAKTKGKCASSPDSSVEVSSCWALCARSCGIFAPTCVLNHPCEGEADTFPKPQVSHLCAIPVSAAIIIRFAADHGKWHLTSSGAFNQRSYCVRRCLGSSDLNPQNELRPLD